MTGAAPARPAAAAPPARLATTRRALLAGAVLAAATAAPARAARDTDAALVTRVLRAELVLQHSYQRCARARDRELRRIARRFGAHEVAHTAALAQALEALGAPGVPVPATPEALDAEAQLLGVAPVLGEARTPEARFEYLIELEQAVSGLLTEAVTELTDDRLVQTVATILGCQAQHLVVLDLSVS